MKMLIIKIKNKFYFELCYLVFQDLEFTLFMKLNGERYIKYYNFTNGISKNNGTYLYPIDPCVIRISLNEIYFSMWYLKES